MRAYLQPLAAALALTCALPTAVGAQVEGEQLELVHRLFVSARVHGAFAAPDCAAGQTRPTEFARHAAQIATLKTDFPESLVVDAGGLLEPHALARFTAAQEPEALADLVADIGYDALGFGEVDLQANRQTYITVARALRARGIPIVASNLRCEESATALCDVLVDADDGVPIVHLGHERVAFLGFLPDDALSRVDPSYAEGLSIAPLRASVEAQVRAARAAGATLVVASLDDGAGEDGALARALSLARRIPEAQLPDVLIAGGAGGSLLFARPARFRPAVVAAPDGRFLDLRVRRDRTTGTLDMLAHASAPADEPAPAATAFAERMGSRFCDEFGAPLAGGALDESRALDRRGLLELAGGAMLEASRAEVAFIHPGAVAADWTPSNPAQLSSSDIRLGLPYDDPLVTVDVPGTWLRSFARDHVGDESLVVLGLTILNPRLPNELIKVNNRPLELVGEYTLVTTRFLAAGGHGLLPTGLDWEAAGDLTLREALIAHLSRPREVDPRDDLEDPADRLEWLVRAIVDASFGGSSIRNPGEFSDSQLQREDTAALGLISELYWSAISRRFAWENTATARYRLASTGGGAFDEGDDRLSYRTTGSYRGLRVRNPVWYMPEPFFENYLETEFTVPDANEHRHMLLRPTAGLRFTLHRFARLKLSGGVETPLLDPDDNTVPGVGAQLEIKPWRLLNQGLRRVTLDGVLDWFWSDMGDESRQAIRGNLNLAFQLNTMLGLSLSVDLFGVSERDRDFSIATNTTAALRLGWLDRWVR